MIRENYYGRTNPNHNRVSKPFPNFEANNPSDVFTQKCLCTTQEYFLPLETESSEIEQLEIRQRMGRCVESDALISEFYVRYLFSICLLGNNL